MLEDKHIEYRLGEMIPNTDFQRRFMNSEETTPVYRGSEDPFGAADHLGLRRLVWEGDLYACLFGQWVIVAGQGISPRVIVQGAASEQR